MKRKILVLEDEENIRSFLVLNLKRSGYEVIEAETGEMALEKYHENQDIAVAVLDVMLPGIDGYEVCRAKASHSSEATVTRLCHKLGYANYRKFQLELARDVLEQQETEARKRPPNDPLHQALLDLQNNRQEEVQATIQALNLVQLRKVLSILRAAEIIEIEANGSSLPVAMDASLKLGSLGKRCMISPVPEKARSFASALTPKDALLLISSAGRCEALETAARAAKKNGTPVILITCDKRSALAGHASYTLLASNRIQRIASDMLPSQLSAALVVEALYYLLVGNFDLN